jgi:hypothetical protein
MISNLNSLIYKLTQDVKKTCTQFMRPYEVILLLIFFLVRNVTFGQSGNGYTTSTTIIKNSDLVGDNEIDTGNFTILKFRNSYDIPGVSDEEHERLVFIKIRSLDYLVLKKTYTLPDSQINAKTYYWSPWFYSETKEIAGTITRIEKNDTAELFQLNLRCINKNGENDTLAWNNYLFKYDTNYFEDNKVEYNGEYDNLRIALKEPLKVKKLDLSYQGVWKYQKNLSGKQELPEFLPRTQSEILRAEDDLVNKVWYNRHHNWLYHIEKGEHTIVPRSEYKGDPKTTPEDIFRGARKAAEKMEEKYPDSELGPWDDFEWGMINGKLSALRWVLGEDWDELYT